MSGIMIDKDATVEWLKGWGENTPHMDSARIIEAQDIKIAALEAENAELRAALEPFAQQANAVEQFVADRAKDDGSPIMPMRAFRLAYFQRASAALGKDFKP